MGDMLRKRQALLHFIVVLSLVGSSVCQEKEGSHGWVLYDDVKSGYQFQYASFLKRNGSTLVNPATNDQIFIQSEFVSWDPKPYLDSAGFLHAAIDHETVNGRRWVTITSPVFKQYYLYVRGHGVAISEGQGVLISLSNARNEHPPTAEELAALRQIVSTLRRDFNNAWQNLGSESGGQVRDAGGEPRRSWHYHKRRSENRRLASCFRPS